MPIRHPCRSRHWKAAVSNVAFLAGTEFWISLVFVGSFKKHKIIRDGLGLLQLAEKFLSHHSHSEEGEEKTLVQHISVFH